MELERLERLVAALTAEFKKEQIGERLEQLESSLQATIGRTETAITEQFVSTRDELIRVLTASISNALRPSETHLLDQLGGNRVIGLSLAQRINGILDGHQVTPTLAVQQISHLRTEVAAFFAGADAFLSGLKGMGFTSEASVPNEEAELGIMLPRLLVRNSLEGLQKELRFLDQYLRAFGELVNQSYGSPTVRSLSTGGFEVFLNQPVVVAAAIMATVERLAALYKQILEIRLLRAQLREKSVSANALTTLEKDEDNMIAAGISQIVEDLLERYRQERASGREEELRTLLLNSVRYLADRIDRGVNFEASPPAIEAEYSDVGESGIAELNRTGAALSGMRRDESPVLRLMSGNSTNEDELPDDDTGDRSSSPAGVP
jgi:hypothetical protein